MAEPSTGDPFPEEPDRGAARAERRRLQRRRLRRQRLGALVGLGLAVAVAVGVVVAPWGGDDSSGAGREAASAVVGRGEGPREGAEDGGGRKAGGSGPVRNATPQPDWRPYTGPVPILGYHVLGVAPADAPFPELYVSRGDFRRQMRWLSRRGYEAVTLEQVQDAWYRGGRLPRKPIVVSFDDGYRPQFTFALPTLRRHGWPGVLFLKAEGSDLYRSNVEAMLRAGWELGSHTIDHSDLTTLGEAELEREVAEARRILRNEYSVPVRNFCYPAGRFDATVVEAVEAAGYAGATTQILGLAERDQPYELKRVPILRSDGVDGLAQKMGAG